MQIGFISAVADGEAKVHKVEESWQYKVGNMSYKEVKVSKGSVMQRPDRAVVVIEHQIPSKFRDAIREAGL